MRRGEANAKVHLGIRERDDAAGLDELWEGNFGSAGDFGFEEFEEINKKKLK